MYQIEDPIETTDKKGSTTMCDHSPQCPSAGDPDCCTAHVTADHMEQGWCRLCNGVILFDDGAYLTPAGEVALLRRPA